MIAALTGLALVLGVAQLLPRHAGSLAILSALQALAAAAALALRGPDPAWLAAGGVSLLLGVVLVPLVVGRLAEGRALLPPARAAWAGVAVLLLGLSVPFGVMGPALGVLLAGLLLIAARPDPLAGVVGLAGMQAGVVLLVATLPSVPLAALPVAAVPLPAGLLLARQWAWAR